MKRILTCALGLFLLAALPAQTKKTLHHTAGAVKSEVKKELTSDELFLKRNPSIKTFSREPGYILVLQKKDGTTEKYMMDIYTDEKKFKGNYGLPPLYKSVKMPTPAEVSN